MTPETIETTESLAEEYNTFLDTNGLPSASADELVHSLMIEPHESRDPVTSARIDYLMAFIERWDIAQEREDSAAMARRWAWRKNMGQQS